MRALVAFESMYGNTARVAEAIGRGLTSRGMDVAVTSVDRVDDTQVVDADLLVVGGPTHAHGLSRHATRDTARTDEHNAYAHPSPEPGLREWLDELPDGAGRAVAAFDTRLQHASFLTGSAAKSILHRLEARGFQAATHPESFFVTDDNDLVEGEETRAERWAADVGGLLEAVLEDRSS